MRMLFQMSYNVLASVALLCIIILHSNSEPISTFSITVMSEQVSKKGIEKLMVSRILETCHYVFK